jgi:RNA polymerase sigma-70 factor (ECF subfamily)
MFLPAEAARIEGAESIGSPVHAIRVPATSPEIAPPSLDELDDDTLMERIGAGDRAAFSQFCRRHAARCLAVTQQLLRNPADAEEAVQDVFLRVWQSAARWRRTEARVTTWLYRVAVNLSLDRLRRVSPLCLPLDHAAQVVASDPNPEALAGGKELARILGRAVASLPVRQRAALSLVIVQGVECAEAARIMEVSIGTMESLLVRGRRRLRLALERATAELPDGNSTAVAAAREFVREYGREGATRDPDAEPTPRSAAGSNNRSSDAQEPKVPLV